MERLQKVIAASGYCSRRKAEDLIREGRVQVNGQPASLGMSVTATDNITVNNQPLTASRSVTYVLNKPKGVVCSTNRQAKEVVVTDLVPSTPPVYPVGRLDKESGGLLLLTNDGTLAQKVAHPSYHHTKVYRVHARWKQDAQPRALEWIDKQLRAGVKLGDGKAKADNVKMLTMEPEVIFELYVHEGRHHLVRRMCAVLGLDVTSLIRVQLASLNLSKLPVGGYRVLTKKEYSSLFSHHEA